MKAYNPAGCPLKVGALPDSLVYFDMKWGNHICFLLHNYRKTGEFAAGGLLTPERFIDILIP